MEIPLTGTLDLNGIKNLNKSIAAYGCSLLDSKVTGHHKAVISDINVCCF